jgi:hypothetical protein
MGKTIKLVVLVVFMSLLALSGSNAFAGTPVKCATIQGGGVVDAEGNPLVLGYDQWGYNYCLKVKHIVLQSGSFHNERRMCE